MPSAPLGRNSRLLPWQGSQPARQEPPLGVAHFELQSLAVRAGCFTPSLQPTKKVRARRRQDEVAREALRQLEGVHRLEAALRSFDERERGRAVELDHG